MRKTLKIQPKPIVVPEREVELKLVQDTRINPNAIHLYARGVDAPLMQFLIRDGKLVFHRLTGTRESFGENIAVEPDRIQMQHSVFAEAPGSNNFYLNWPRSAEVFDEKKPGQRIEYEPDPSTGRPSSADLDVVASDPFYADKFTAKPRC